MRRGMTGGAVGLLLTLAGCGGGEPTLMNLRAGQTTPDEFAILPTRPLTMPPDMAVLPPPAPGGTNLTDPNPRGDAVAALGGDPGRLVPTGPAVADGALIARAGRAGTDPAIRETLAAEDVAWRKGQGRRVLERLAGTSVYQRAYRPQRLDADAELQRWRQAGARTPSAPPPDAE